MIRPIEDVGKVVIVHATLPKADSCPFCADEMNLSALAQRSGLSGVVDHRANLRK